MHVAVPGQLPHERQLKHENLAYLLADLSGESSQLQGIISPVNLYGAVSCCLGVGPSPKELFGSRGSRADLRSLGGRTIQQLLSHQQ